MRRVLRIAASVLGGLVLLPLVALLVLLNTDYGQRLVPPVLAWATSGEVVASGLSGRFPDRLLLAHVALRDRLGVWVSADGIVLDWSPLQLVHGLAAIETLSAATVALPRLPESASPAQASAGQTGFSLPVRVSIRALHVGRADIGEAVAGTAASLALDGHVTLTSLREGEADVTISDADGPGRYHVSGHLDPAQVRAAIAAREPAQGLLARLAGLPDLGELVAEAHLDGPLAATTVSLTVTAGELRATAHGTVDLDHDTAALDVAASAPAMQPRADLAWRALALDAHVHGPFTGPDATGTLRIDGVSAGGAALRSLTAEVAGNAGRVTLHMLASGLRIPGPDPGLLEESPVTMQAAVGLDTPDRPVDFSLSHKLLSVSGHVSTGDDLAARVNLTLPALAPFAAMAKVDLQGSAAMALRAAIKGRATMVDLDGNARVTGGMAPIPGLIGEDARLAASARIEGGDVTITRAAVDGRALHVSAEGTDTAGVLALRWTLGLPDLSVLASAIAGELEAHGTVQGQTESIAVDADMAGAIGTPQVPRGPITIALHAAGLPSAPNGRITAQGTFDGAPVLLAAEVARSADGTLHAHIAQADWKSAHADADLTLPPGASLPQGQAALRMTRLADLRGLLGTALAGSVTATASLPVTGDARLQVEARDVGVPGSKVDRVTLDAAVAAPMTNPVVRARLRADGIAASGVTGSALLSADGPLDSVALRLSAGVHDVAGADASITAAALLDAPARRLQLSDVQAIRQAETLRLLAPARIDFADGVTVSRLRLGVRNAVAELAGRISPTLGLTASLRGVDAALLKPFVPALDADGVVSAEARLSGAMSRPLGTVTLTAAGMRLRTGPGRALPAANLKVTARLAGTRATVDARLTAGSATQVVVTGTAPLDPNGAFALQLDGAADLAMADPLLAADGRLLRGRATLDAGLAGSLAAPRLSGTLQVVNGEVQDFAQGLHVSGLAATIAAAGDTLRLVRLTGTAGPGTISASGSVGVLAPGMPVDLRVSLRHARPLSSDLLSALMDADVTVSGHARGALAVAGAIHVSRANITVPDQLPSSVAVLNVRLAGQKPPPPAPPPLAVALDLTIDAPRAIFVRGHGLDAELGGKLSLGGSSAAPVIQGGFDLRRGTFSLVGQTITFTTGHVGFDGTGVTGRIDPTLDFVANVTSGTTTATLAVGGYASKPTITLSSSPDLPQDEILAQVLFGQSATSLGPFQIAEIAAALASLTGAGGAALDPLSGVRKSLGLDRLSVGSGGANGNAATLQAGRYVADGVYVGAKQGTSGAGTQLQVQVDLYKGLKLETDIGSGSNSATGSGASSGSNVGLTYQFEY